MIRLIVLVTLVFFGCKSEEKRNDRATHLESPKPNIIFILADDLGYGDLGCYGQESIQTPHIDQLAKQGMKFTQHYAGSAVCAPSRCALMTGMDMGHAEVRGNLQAEPSGQLPISNNTVTIAERLKEAGYTTGMIGKWGLGIEGSVGEPNKQGFDYYYGYLDQVLAHNNFPEYLLRNGQRVMLHNKVKYLSETAWHKGLGSYAIQKRDYAQDLFDTEALEFIDRHKNDPFFLYFPTTIPHDNGEAPEGETMEIPDYGPYAKKEWSDDHKGYAAMITRLDESVGLVMKKLEQLGIADNTLIIFSSDNGPAWDWLNDDFDSNGPLRGKKRDLYEGGIRVPLIAHWPGKIKAGSESTHLSAFWDFYPTACELAGLSIPPEVNGISYLQILLGKTQKTHDYLYWEFYEQQGSRAIRKGKWKAVQNDMHMEQKGQMELYNLETDIGETTDLAVDYPDVIATLDSLMEDATTPSEHFQFYKTQLE